MKDKLHLRIGGPQLLVDISASSRSLSYLTKLSALSLGRVREDEIRPITSQFARDSRSDSTRTSRDEDDASKQRRSRSSSHGCEERCAERPRGRHASDVDRSTRKQRG